ncbi:holo-[acyl-carrier-protein] synthase [Streptomyces misionensis]|uniref:Holo-[acyl-carrier-protein] synthase n=1 Tax=Streptomyces misionensis TaxID=67331 RepID=A0A1H4UJ34_9ACTN|nr:4'-phosphopantetheinyl transferase superfamily protein [Streptomyces misionensis]SEC68687.1 holo-[acyl-carrier-protein] synthase [Streptomyces misionensis]
MTSGRPVGVGLDVLDRDELKRLVTRGWFLRYCYAPEEIEQARALQGVRRLEYLAGRFAAKEAVLKALGRGLLQGIAPRNIRVERAADGSPRVELRGEAARVASRRTVRVSITHKKTVVAAAALLVQPE